MIRMKDTPILFLTVGFMLLILFAGQFLRGEYAFTTDMLPARSSAGQTLAVEQDGRALININSADVETLMLADGVGEALSSRIILYREEHGPFSSLDDLLNVNGIGEKTLESIRSRFTCIPE